MFLYLTKTFMVETLYYCNLLCYVECSTSLLIFEATAMSLCHITPTHPHTCMPTHTLHTHTHPHTHTHTHMHAPTHMHAHPHTHTPTRPPPHTHRCAFAYTHPTHTQGSPPLQRICSVTRHLNEVPTEALHILGENRLPKEHTGVSLTHYPRPRDPHFNLLT